MADNAILFVTPRAKLPVIPLEYRRLVSVSKVDIEIDDPILNSCDKYLIQGASAGFSPKGVVRLKLPDEHRPVTWIASADIHLIHGIKNGKPWIDLNYRFCRNCQKISAYTVKAKPKIFKPKEVFTYLHCPECGASWRIFKKATRRSIDTATIRRSTKPRISTKRR